MNKLKLGALEDNKPVKITVELPAAIHRDLVAYAETLSRETGQSICEAGKLISPMIERFMATDRGFAKSQRERPTKISSVTLPKLPKHAT